MPEIQLHSFKTDLGIISTYLNLVGYIFFPKDSSKRQQMTGLLNTELYLKIKGEYSEIEALDNDAMVDQSWCELSEFFEEREIEMPFNPNTSIEKKSFLKTYQKYMTELAALDLALPTLPEDLPFFLINSPTPNAIRDEMQGKLKSLYTALMIVQNLRKLEQLDQPLRGGASLNSAKLLVELQGHEFTHKNRKYIDDAWDDFKRSVHLFWGATILRFLMDSPNKLRDQLKVKGGLKGNRK